jgi:hypothetical protein
LRVDRCAFLPVWSTKQVVEPKELMFKMQPITQDTGAAWFHFNKPPAAHAAHGNTPKKASRHVSTRVDRSSFFLPVCKLSCLIVGMFGDLRFSGSQAIIEPCG